MKHKLVYTIGAIVLFIFGFLFLIAPIFGLRLYGYDVSAADLAPTIARYWGSAFIGVAFILLTGRNAQADSIGVNAINYGGFALSLSGLAVSVLDVVGGTPNALIWLTVALYAVFTVLFGLLLFKKK
jgi:hypothetical protein